MWGYIYMTTDSTAGALNINRFELRMNGERDFVEAARKFIRLASITTFIHHTTVLIIILVVISINPDYLNDDGFKYLKLKPDNLLFYVPFIVTISMGLISMLLSIVLASKLVIAKVDDRESGVELE